MTIKDARHGNGRNGVTWRVIASVMAMVLFAVLAWLGKNTVEKLDSAKVKIDDVNRQMALQTVEITALRQQVTDLSSALVRPDERVVDVGMAVDDLEGVDMERMRSLIKSALSGERTQPPQ